jgi:hypothetical protein
VEQKRLAWKQCSSNPKGLKEYAGDDLGVEPWGGYKSDLNVLTSTRSDGYTIKIIPFASYPNLALERFWDSTIPGENQVLQIE